MATIAASCRGVLWEEGTQGVCAQPTDQTTCGQTMRAGPARVANAVDRGGIAVQSWVGPGCLPSVRTILDGVYMPISDKHRRVRVSDT